MRLISTMLAVMLALALAIFPISGGQSAATIGHQHHHSVQTNHAGDHSIDAAADELASAADDCAGHKAPQGKQAGCCDMGACHAFTTASLTILAYSASLVGSVADRRDDQVRGEPSARLERPPRTV